MSQVENFMRHCRKQISGTGTASLLGGFGRLAFRKARGARSRLHLCFCVAPVWCSQLPRRTSIPYELDSGFTTQTSRPNTSTTLNVCLCSLFHIFRDVSPLCRVFSHRLESCFPGRGFLFELEGSAHCLENLFIGHLVVFLCCISADG